MQRNGAKIGVLLPQAEYDTDTAPPRWTDILSFAQAAEVMGFDSVWAVDHLLMDWPEVARRAGWTDAHPSLTTGPDGHWECWSVLAAIAAQTTRVEIGSLVTCVAYRNPALLVKIAQTVDEISDGRVILGIGAGDFPAEFTMLGVPWDRRVSRFEEALQIVDGLVRHGRSSFTGSFYQLTDCEVRPRGPRTGRIPLLVGALANRPRMTRLVLQYADIWNTWLYGGDSRPAEAKRRWAGIAEACERHGRNPDSLERSIAVGVRWGGRLFPGEQSLTGSTAEIASDLQQIIELGYTHIQIVLVPRTMATLERLARVLDEIDR